MPNVAPKIYERNADGFAVPDAGGTLGVKYVPVTFEDTTVTINLPQNGVLVDMYLSMSTVFDGSAPTVIVTADGDTINTFDPGNAMSRDVSGLLPVACQTIVGTVDADSSTEGAGQLVIIYAAI